jgi:hypothetical protein
MMQLSLFVQQFGSELDRGRGDAFFGGCSAESASPVRARHLLNRQVACLGLDQVDALAPLCRT